MKVFQSFNQRYYNNMLAYFVSEIDIRIKKVVPEIIAGTNEEEILKKIQHDFEALKQKCDNVVRQEQDELWNEGCRLERMLALIEPRGSLWPELKRRIARAKVLNLTGAPRLQAEFDAIAPLVIDTQKTPPELRDNGVPIVRALLLDALEEIHYSRQKKYRARPIQIDATLRVTILVIVSFLIFIYPYISLYKHFTQEAGSVWEYWAWLPLYTAFSAGLFGALFSRLLFLQANWNTLSTGWLYDAKSFPSILLRACVGMTGAVIVMFFLQSGVMQGSLFPNFGKLNFEERIFPSIALELGQQQAVANLESPKAHASAHPLHILMPSQDLALLIVWSFLAGFSERLVPSILRESESRIGKK